MAQTLIAAFYKFVTLDDAQDVRDAFQTQCQSHDVKGTVLVADEGINGTIGGPEQGIRAVLAYLRQDPRLVDLMHKESWADETPFYRLKVSLKKEIVKIGMAHVDPTKAVGHYVKPKDWNALISDPSVLVIDTRNDYEVKIGTFKGAVDPDTQCFTEFPTWFEDNCDPKAHTKIAMFCTGGIRCEKATSYLVDKGISEVYHLEGGILKYLEEVPSQDSLWEGECFVFDNRVSVGHALKQGAYIMCPGCRWPVSEEDTQSEYYEMGVCCPRCHDVLTDEQRRRFSERHKQIQLAAARNEVHLGRAMNRGEHD